MQKTLPAQIPVVRWTCKVAERFAKNFLHAHKRCFDKNTKVQQTHLKSRCKTISLHHIQSLAKINDQISHALPLSLKTWHHHRMLSWARSITWEHIFPYKWWSVMPGPSKRSQPPPDNFATLVVPPSNGAVLSARPSSPHSISRDATTWCQ